MSKGTRSDRDRGTRAARDGETVVTRRRRALFAVLTVLFATALSLALAEGAVRLLDLASEVRAHFQPGIFAPDPDLGWVLKPSYRGLRLEDDRRVPTSTNTLGFRGPDWVETRRRAAVRLLALGDSSTFGLGVADDETYPAYLEKSLREGGRDAAVFNAGVPGYETAREAEIFRRLAPIVGPHIVIVTWLSNDVARWPVADERRVQVLDGYLVDDVDRYIAWRERIDHRSIYASAFYRFMRVRVRLVRDRLGMRHRSWSQTINPEKFRSTTDALLKIKREADALGAAVVLVTLPRREQVEGSVGASDLSYLAEFGRSHGMEVVEPLSLWKRPGGESRPRFLNDNVHLTAHGYRGLAEAIAGAASLQR